MLWIHRGGLWWWSKPYLLEKLGKNLLITTQCTWPTGEYLDLCQQQQRKHSISTETVFLVKCAWNVLQQNWYMKNCSPSISQTASPPLGGGYKFLPHSLKFRFLVWAPNSTVRWQKVISEETFYFHFLLISLLTDFSLLILFQLNASQGHLLYQFLTSWKLTVSWDM